MLNEVLDEVDTAVERVLANITIKDVVSRLKPCVSTSGGSQTEEALGKNSWWRPETSNQLVRITTAVPGKVRVQ